MSMYPRKVVIENDKLKKLLAEKEEYILRGREMSKQIEDFEKKMQDADKNIQDAEKKVDVSDINERANAITDEFNAIVSKMEELKKELYTRIKANVPEQLYSEYESIAKSKEEAETERNKIALKAQKVKDRIIPIAQSAMKMFIEDEYEDFSGIRLEGEKIIGTIFSHLDEFKTNFRKRNAIQQ